MNCMRKRRKGTYLAFLDVSKAYDTVWREGLWEKMRCYGVTQKFVRVRQGLYEEVEASVVQDGEQSRWCGKVLGRDVPCHPCCTVYM